ncbi:hypothetical protein [uncultured Microbulbifer sp.]|uniref:hypothetical protein n=1 Tax=uncultured Microbulbifer sp. TaxID=348147 RepID=UPI00260E4FA9|nr:hypothetical protein [uncultured Microbulbifer sp.]
MSIGQQIYFAIELFAPGVPHRERFCAQLARILTGNGSPPLAAKQIASVLADALSAPSADSHLAMAHLLTFHPPLSSLLEKDPAAAGAMHQYMAYFLELMAVETGSEARFAVN